MIDIFEKKKLVNEAKMAVQKDLDKLIAIEHAVYTIYNNGGSGWVIGGNIQENTLGCMVGDGHEFLDNIDRCLLIADEDFYSTMGSMLGNHCNNNISSDQVNTWLCAFENFNKWLENFRATSAFLLRNIRNLS